MLDPEFVDVEYGQEVTDGFDQFVLKVYPEPLEPDCSALEEAAAAQALERYQAAKAKHTELLAEVDRQLCDYRSREGLWGREKVWVNAGKVVLAVQFWNMYGQAPLKKVAMRARGQASGAAAAERGHKWMNFVLRALPTQPPGLGGEDRI